MDTNRNQIVQGLREQSVKGPVEIYFKHPSSFETMNNLLPVDREKCSVTVPKNVTLKLTERTIDFNVNGSGLSFSRNSVFRVTKGKKTIW